MQATIHYKFQTKLWIYDGKTMKRIKTYLLIFFSLVIIAAIVWCFRMPTKEVNISDTLLALPKTPHCLPLRMLYTEEAWDSMLVMRPYSDHVLKDYKIEITSNSDQEVIHDNSIFDSICTLLFIKNHKVVAFSSVYRDVIDFTKLEKNFYPATDSIQIKQKAAMDCQKNGR